MVYSNSFFTIEINGVPTAAFEAKWHSEADTICRSWVDLHWEQLQAKGRHGSDLPPMAKVRISRPDEREKFEAGWVDAELLGDVRLVVFVDLALRRRD